MPTRPRPPSIGSGNHRSRTLFLFTSRNSRRVSDGSLRRETRIAFRMPWLACFARRVSRLIDVVAIDVVAIDVNHKTRAVNQPCAAFFWPLRSNSRPFFFPSRGTWHASVLRSQGDLHSQVESPSPLAAFSTLIGWLSRPAWDCKTWFGPPFALRS